MKAAQREEPDQQTVVFWKNLKQRTLVRIRMIVERKGMRICQLAIAGRGTDRVERPERAFPDRMQPLRTGDVFVAYVNLFAERVRDLDIAFER